MKFKKTIGIIGMGYVGLPLAVAFGKKHRVNLEVSEIAFY